MRITYKIPELPEPGDNDLSKGIEEINKKNYQIAQTHFEKSVTYGNEYGQLFCALIHFGGFDISKRNPTKALEYFQAAETQWKNKIAQFFIGIIYLAGDGVVFDGKTGWEWIEKSCQNGCIIGNVLKAQNSYDEMNDYKKAFFYFKQAVESDLYNNNTLCLFENINFKVDFDDDYLSNSPFKINTITLQPIYLTQYCKLTEIKTFNSCSLWYILSNNSYTVSNCQLSIGSLYYTGLGDTEKDYQKSLEYFYKSAKNQNPIAYHTIGLQFEEGAGVEQDFSKAFENYLKAISLGDNESLLNIAIFYFNGTGVSKDYQTSLSYVETYLNKESTFRIGEAYLLLGCLYRKGKNGIKQDCKKAVDCFKKAWEQDKIEIAAFQIGEMYDEGVGVEKNKKDSIDWYSKAVSLDFYPAYYKLGCLELISHKANDGLGRALDYLKKAEEIGIIKDKEMIQEILVLLLKRMRLSKK